MTKEADFGVATWISQNLAIEYVIFKSSRVSTVVALKIVHRFNIFAGRRACFPLIVLLVFEILNLPCV